MFNRGEDNRGKSNSEREIIWRVRDIEAKDN
jgi:hypothetical protein